MSELAVSSGMLANAETPPSPCGAVPYPPLNLSHSIVHLSQRVGQASPDSNEDSRTASRRTSRQAVGVPSTTERPEAELWAEEHTSEAPTGSASQGPSGRRNVPTGTDAVHQTARDDWPDPTQPVLREADEEFVNAVAPDYEDSNEPGSAMDLPTDAPVRASRAPPVLLELRWLPPRPPTSYDGFNVYIYRDGRTGGGASWSGTAGVPHLSSYAGNVTESASVDQNTHEFFTELTEPGTYRIQVTTLSSAGACQARESSRGAGFTCYLGGCSHCRASGTLLGLLVQNRRRSQRTKPSPCVCLQVPTASCGRSSGSVLRPSPSDCWTPASPPCPGTRPPRTTTGSWCRWCPPRV